MTKRNKLIYWIATIWLSLGMISSGMVQLLKVNEETDVMAHLGLSYLFFNHLGHLEIIGRCNSTCS